MRLRITKLAAFAAFSLLFSSCGSNSTSFVGPVLDIAELTTLKIDQFYTESGLEDEYASTGEFAIYLRDAVTGQDIACAGQDQGMDKLGMTKTYYGDLNISLREVQGDHPSSSARFQIVFVEKDGADCPNTITSSDDIIGITPEFAAEDMLGQRIWTSNGLATVLFRFGGTSTDEPSPMASAMQDALIVDQVGFENGNDGNEEHRYFLFAERYEGSEVIETCQIEDDNFDNVRFGNMIYAALNLIVPCFTSESPDFLSMRVRFSLWIQKNDGPKLIGETDIMKISDMVGERLEFTNGSGYVRLRNVATTPFSARFARLEELANLKLDSLEYGTAASAVEQVEVHLRSPKGYSVVCTGPDQGLLGTDSPNTSYTTLNAQFVAAEGQRELFGWDELDLVVVGRSDGNVCPTPLSDGFSVLGEAPGLEPVDLEAGSANLTEGGSATWSYEASSSS